MAVECESGQLDGDEFVRVLGVELGRSVELTRELESARVRVACHDDSVSIERRLDEGAPMMWRLPVDESAPAEVRPRTVALVVVELLSAPVPAAEATVEPEVVAARGRAGLVSGATRAALATGTSAPPEAPASVPSPPGVTTHDDDAWHVELGLDGRLLVLTEREHVLFGGALRAAWVGLRHLSVALEVVAFHDEESLSRGTASVTAVSGALLVGGRLPGDSLRVTLEGGLRAGVVWLVPEADPELGIDGEEVTGPWGGPVVGLGLDLHLVGPLWANARTELGYALWSVGGLVGTTREVETGGAWLGVTLGLSVDVGP